VDVADRGESSFAELAQQVLSAISRLLGRDKKSRADRYTSDVMAVRDALSNAFAEVTKRGRTGRAGGDRRPAQRV